METQTDANPAAAEGASSTPPDAQGASSAQTTQSSPPSGLADALKGVMDKHLATEAKEETPTTPEGEAPPVEEGETSETTTLEKETETEEKEESEEKTDDKGPVPYTRFQEVIEAKNQAEAQVKEWQPFVQAQESIQAYCQEHSISPKEFNEWFETLVAIKSDPQKGQTLLQPYLQQVQAETGSVLPQDLQAAVDAGELKLDLAKELAQSRAKLKLSERQGQEFQQRTVQQRQAELTRSYESTLSNFYASKAKTDPDFVPSKNGKDGKYEFWLDKFQVEFGRSLREGKGSVEALAAAAEKAYTAVNSFAKRFTPPVNGSKTIRTSQSGAAPVAAPTTLKGAMAAIAKRHGFNV